MNLRYLLLVPVSLNLICCKPASKMTRSAYTNSIDSFVNNIMHELPDIPGMAIVVVSSKGPVFMKGCGWADKEAKIKTGINTVFNIGSTTKSFTGLLSTINDEKKLIMLDSPFLSYLKNTNFKNEIGRDITIENLLSHSSGLENPPFTFRLAYSGLTDSAGLSYSLAQATVAKTKPGTYRYTNLGYNIYSTLLKSYAKKDWRDELKEEILNPLNMKMTTAYMSVALQNEWQMAVPYDAYGSNGFARINLVKQDNVMHSAGGVVSTINDLSKWIQVQLGNGVLMSKRIFSEAVIAKSRTAYVRYENFGNPFGRSGAYALGWEVNNYKGLEVYCHEGSYPGYRAHLSFVPSLDIGIAILINEEVLGVRTISILSNYIYDLKTGSDSLSSEYPRRIEALKTRHKKEAEDAIKSELEISKRPSKLSLPLTSYTGIFYNALYGEMQVYINKQLLAVKHGNLYSEFSTFYIDPESIRVVLIPGSGQPIIFRVNEGKVTGLRYAGEEFSKR